MDMLRESFERLHENKEFCDLIISNAEREWRVHKVIVCGHSHAFRTTLLRGAELEQVQEKNRINLDDDSIAIDMMVYFMYHGDYDNYKPLEGEDVSELEADILMYMIGDKYLMRPLVELALENFTSNCEQLKAAHLFVDGIVQVYSIYEAEHPLKNVILKTAKTHIALLIGNTGTEQAPIFQKALREVPNFAADLVLELGKAFATSQTAFFVTYRARRILQSAEFVRFYPIWK